MSDVDDWFEKDEDSLVEELKIKSEGAANLKNCETVERIIAPKKKYREIKVQQNATKLPNFFQTSTLQNLITKEPLEIFLYLATKTCLPVDELLSLQIDESSPKERILLYLKLIRIIYDLNIDGFKEDILKVFVTNDVLLDRLRKFIGELFDKKYASFWSDIQENQFFIEDLVSLIHHAVKEKELNTKSELLFESSYKAMLSCNRKDLQDTSYFKKNLLILEQLHQSNKSEPGKAQSFLSKTFREENDMLPTLDEIKSNDEKFSLNLSLLNTQNTGTNSLYIQKQMLILREDFMVSLRKYIQSVKLLKDINSKYNKTIWPNVRIGYNNHFATANRYELLFVDLMGSRREAKSEISITQREYLENLKTGALLCFTTSWDFDNLICATVTYTEKTLLRNGFVGIEIKSQYFIGKIHDVDFLMFESPAFFEPYNNAYNVLKTYDIDELFIMRYIIHGEKTPVQPLYLNSGIKDKTSKLKMIKVTNFGGPSLEMPLDDLQFKAVDHALKNDLCLIQGPPGTGKTLVTVQIVKAILENSSLESPVVIVTYTNEALDKIILRISEKLNYSIMRFGKQTRSNDIKSYTESEIINNTYVNQNLKRLYYLTTLDLKSKFKRLRELQEEFDGSEEFYQRIITGLKELKKCQRKYDSVRLMFQYYSAKNNSIIAMTTTCAAKMNGLFRFLKAPVVIFDEAAEILESHIFACLTKYTKHVIMIGDHKQLQPYASDYQFSKTHGLNVSLFERLMNQDIKHVVLNKQYRMRPIISDLLCPLFYEKLSDGDNVVQYPDVRGMGKNLFFLNHSNREEYSKEEKSISNNAEVRLLLKLALYLILDCNYNKNEIVILTPYARQVDLYKQNKIVIENDLRVSTVDSFQGLEANIILLSLVRNNNTKEIGFLQEKNRICVALSRAKYGLYIAGNIDLLAQCSDTWRLIKQKLEINQCLGEDFPYAH